MVASTTRQVPWNDGNQSAPRAQSSAASTTPRQRPSASSRWVVPGQDFTLSMFACAMQVVGRNRHARSGSCGALVRSSVASPLNAAGRARLGHAANSIIAGTIARRGRANAPYVLARRGNGNQWGGNPWRGTRRWRKRSAINSPKSRGRSGRPVLRRGRNQGRSQSGSLTRRRQTRQKTRGCPR
jgi:hypothetical protein